MFGIFKNIMSDEFSIDNILLTDKYGCFLVFASLDDALFYIENNKLEDSFGYQEGGTDIEYKIHYLDILKEWR